MDNTSTQVSTDENVAATVVIKNPDTISPSIDSKNKKYFSSVAIILGTVFIAVCLFLFRESFSKGNFFITKQASVSSSTELVSESNSYVASSNTKIPFEKQSITIAPAVSQNFSMSEIKNFDEIKKAYGVTFTQDELNNLEKNKFVIKNLMDTNFHPVNVGDNMREIVSLYSTVSGPYHYKERNQANAVFISSDVLMNLFSILSVDLLKETENKYLYKDVLASTAKLYNDASDKIKNSKTDSERKEWTKVRNYFAIPYALLSTSIKPVTADDYWKGDTSIGLEETLDQYKKKDALVDNYDKVTDFVKKLQLDTNSESLVLADLKMIYDAKDKGVPFIFNEEYKNIPGDIKFSIPYSLFKVRGSYTSSSLRRQYFRAVQWYQQVPFFVSSKELTTYAVNIGELMNNNPELLKQYNSMSSLLGVLVGKSDDLDVNDYAEAVSHLKTETRDMGKLSVFLNTQKPQARIKSMPATYSSVGIVEMGDVMNATRGMRFFSQKFLPDSYWTGKLTQGDEKTQVNGMTLPKDASSLEVMSILGSSYATSKLTDLPFYKEHKGAIDARLSELTSESKGWGTSYWQSNQVTSILWTISGLFSWLEKNQSSAPQFMQSPLWNAKTLLTASSFWTEMRHTNILYGKQSFAEMGAGSDDMCDRRPVPSPVQGYIEPQPESYDRLYFTARLLQEEYTSRGFELQNMPKLAQYIELMYLVREYTKLELENTAYIESTSSKSTPLDGDPQCVVNFITPESSIKRDEKGVLVDSKGDYTFSALSRSEEIRTGIISRIRAILPLPVEGPILPIKDKRMAVVADVHTSQSGILEEGVGVPRVIFVAVKDANGPRLTVGFTYSHYEFLSPTRLTDEEWQSRFYTDEGGDSRITYKPKNMWPTIPTWYQELLGTK